jgi:hypothetical protein
VSIDELTALTWNGIARIEIDCHFKTTLFSEIIRR